MLDMYLKLRILGDFIIPIALILLVVLIFLFLTIKFKIDRKFKKNCFKCKHYKLHNVSSVGGKCTYKCHKFDRTDRHDMNTNYNLVKCDYFKTETPT